MHIVAFGLLIELRTAMSSSMRQRHDGFSLIGVSCLEVGVLDPSNPKRERSLAKLNEIIDGTIDIIELAKRNQ
jgi:hypothetical protein